MNKKSCFRHHIMISLIRVDKFQSDAPIASLRCFKKTQVYLLGRVCNPAIGFPVAILEFKQHFNYIILPSLANFDFVQCLIISLFTV